MGSLKSISEFTLYPIVFLIWYFFLILFLQISFWFNSIERFNNSTINFLFSSINFNFWSAFEVSRIFPFGKQYAFLKLYCMHYFYTTRHSACIIWCNAANRCSIYWSRIWSNFLLNLLSSRFALPPKTAGSKVILVLHSEILILFHDLSATSKTESEIDWPDKLVPDARNVIDFKFVTWIYYKNNFFFWNYFYNNFRNQPIKTCIGPVS